MSTILQKHKNKHGLFFLTVSHFPSGSIYFVNWHQPNGHFHSSRFSTLAGAKQFFSFVTGTKTKVKQLNLFIN